MMKILSDKLVKTLGVIAFAGLTAAADAQTFNWAPAGPIYTAGRVRNMIVDKNNSSILYVGSTSSGVFKSTDAGANWFPLNDQGTIRNISYMAQSVNGDIYAGTGEGFLRTTQKAKALRGTGLYRLMGNNLTLIPGSDSSITGKVINKVACHPTQNNWLALATDKGILISTNGGATYMNAPGTPTNQTGLDIKFDNNGILYCSIGSELSNALNSTVWKSDANLTSFTNITPYSAAVSNTAYGRIELAVSPSNPGVVYASCSGKYLSAGSATLAGLFVSYDGGSSWGTILVGAPQLDPLSNGTTRASGDYAHTIAVDPSNSNRILLGSYQLYSFTRTGGTNASPIGTWTKLGNYLAFNAFPQIYVHENIHDLKRVVIGQNVYYYIITDAGIYRTVDNFTSFQPFYKGLVTGQFNSVSIERYPLAGNAGSSVPGTTINPYSGYIGGTGGNGMIYFAGAYPNVNKEISQLGGDIFNAEYSKILPNAAYVTTGNGPLYRTSDVKTADPAQVNFVSNAATQAVSMYNNSTYSVSGSPFKLWEYYGQLYKGTQLSTPDSMVFYNDTSFALASIPSVTASTNFTFTIGRPQKSAIIDYIVVRALLVKVPITPSAITIPSFSVVNSKTLAIQCSSVFVLPAAGTASAQGTSTVPLTSVEGYTAAATFSLNKVTVNSYTNLDEIQVALAGPLFTSYPASTPSSTNVETYMRMRATVFYRYDLGDSITLVDDNISTLSKAYNVTTKQKTFWYTAVPSGTVNKVFNAVQKYPMIRSARLAVGYSNSGVYVSKAPLDLNAPLSFVKVSADKALTTDANGAPLPPSFSNTVSVTGRPTLLEWSKSGTELYYATDANNLYRVSNIFTIMDSTSKSYSGKLHTNIFTYSNTPAPAYTGTTPAFNTPNPNSPYRTAFLGNFPKKITSISVGSNDSIITLTFDDPTPTGTLVMSNTIDIRKCNSTNVGFKDKTGSLNNLQVYTSLMEKDDYRKVYLGTTNGVYYTSDITAATPTWSNVNTVSADPNKQLPNVQIFDIKQQTLNSWECYNSGQIYVATNGRGIWTNNDYYTPSVVSVEEIVKSGYANNLSIYPNPSNGEVHVTFKGFENEKVVINLMDMNGRLVMSDYIGKISTGDVSFSFDTASLPSGVYVVNVTSDSGIRRVSKLVVTK
jgi:hypothetical protein